MDLNSENIHNLPQHLYQYLYLLQMVGYFPYLPHDQIDTTKDNRMILAELWELGDIQPTYITIPNVNQSYTHLWN
jgi:hypothetical protein